MTKKIVTTIGGGLAVAGWALAGALAAGSALAADVTFDRMKNADRETGNWILHARTYDGHRNSPLAQINKDNVRNLQIAGAWMLAPTEGAGRYAYGVNEATPLVEDGFMYVADGWSNVYKLDVRNGNAPFTVWKWDPKMDRVYASDSGCCQARNRGVALWKNQVIVSTLDGRMVAINKDTGEQTWEAKTADNDVMESHTGAPLVVGDLGVNGVTGGEYGIRGHLDAVNLTTGKVAYRTWLIPGPGEKGFETWEDKYDAWMTGGASVWVTATYDPELNLMYWGTGNPAPQYDAEYRPGDNLYTDSTVAVDVATGKIVHHYQYTPNDPYDWDEVGEALLIDTQIGNEARKIYVKYARNGFVYGIDRRNGQFVYGQQYVNVQNWTPGGIDPKTGKPMSYDAAARGIAQMYAPGTAGRRDNRVAVFCPALGGGKNWHPSAYSARTGLIYTGAVEGCSGYKTVKGGVDHWAEKGNKKGSMKTRDPAGWRGRENAPAGTAMPVMDTRGSVVAVDAKTGKTVAKTMTRTRPYGVVVTAGGLVFAADETGDITAYDYQTLEPLWVRNVGTGFAAPPMTYSVGGKQYIAVLAGNAPGDGTRRTWPETKFMAPSNMLFLFSL